MQSGTVEPWRAHPLCASDTPWPSRFWGPERIDPTAWRELADLIDAEAEVEALVAALTGVDDVVDVGGGTGFITQAIAARVAPVTIIEPSAEQRAHLPAGFTAIDGRAEALPLPDGATAAALATWVLQYTDDPALAVRELGRIARERVVIVQAAPGNDLVDVYNLEASIAGGGAAHHGWILANAAAALTGVGFAVELERVASPVRLPAVGAAALADTLSRLHFAGHSRRSEMRAATEPLIAARAEARGGWLADDGVVLVAKRVV